MTLAPIVLFVYNRPHHTQQTVEALQQNELANESEIFIYSDAPKNEQAIHKVQEVRSYIKSISGFKKITIIERETNWGLAKSIIDGVTSIVNQYGKIIVLEDDLVTSSYFLRFMNEALEMYQDTEKIFGITGYNYPININGLEDIFFMKAENCWSWATWDRAWKYFVKDTDMLINTFNKHMIKEFNFNHSIDFWSQVLANKQGKINTWAVFWYATIFINNKLFVFPKTSFVNNIGHDGSGTHCDKNNLYYTNITNNYNLVFSNNMIESQIARQKHIEYFLSLKKSIITRIFNKIKNKLDFIWIKE